MLRFDRDLLFSGLGDKDRRGWAGVGHRPGAGTMDAALL
ncbi:hypothetical protein LCGC14_0456540 [marine sediment metagenome]|uniref:Uncharacterized protein n=1 Tax=marine sediment metagenome TaxID=412755 RepID=A0A0F9SLN7_9ZZZZ